jgi:hypothetical protein
MCFFSNVGARAIVIGCALLSAVLLTRTIKGDSPLITPGRADLNLADVGKRTRREVQQPGKFREYDGWEYENFPVPADYQTPGEWTFARFMYRAVMDYYRGGRGRNWTIDYPRSDRHL